MKNRIYPVLLGADLNCYSMARAFHENTGAISDVFAKEELGPIRYSRFVSFCPWPFSFSDEKALPFLLEFAEQHPDSPRVLIGCTDEYALFISKNKEALSAAYFCPYPDFETAKSLISKESFYEAAKEWGLPYPKTVASSSPFDEIRSRVEVLRYPLVIKPSSSVSYWEHPFPGMKKVYFVRDPKEAKTVSDQILLSGYPDPILYQSYIEGSDIDHYVITCYSDREGQVRMVAPARVLLEEHTPRAIGNHAAVLTCRIPQVTDLLLTFLNGIGYKGFSNFDLKRDKKTGKYVFFEINLRQGRSNYYLAGSKINPAELIEHDLRNDWNAKVLYPSVGYFWHTVPTKIVLRYLTEESLIRQIDAAQRKGKESDSLASPFDLKRNPRRRAYVFFHNKRYKRKYRQNETPSFLK